MSAINPVDVLLENFKKQLSENASHQQNIEDSLDYMVQMMGLLVKSVDNLSKTVVYHADILEQKK